MGWEAPAMIGPGTKALVTGGGGFLGMAVVKALLEKGASVRSFARGEYPELEKLGVEVQRGDLADAPSVSEACKGCTVVFHIAAKAGIWGPRREYHDANVKGTENVIAACRAHGISRLVATSTPAVVFDGADMESIDESVPYSSHAIAHYPRTKAMGERLVLEANDENLRTVALRPHLIWGPGDRHLVPRLLDRARTGALRIIGDGKNKVDSTYVDNAADAHLLAADRLDPGSPVAGRAYFISQGEPVVLWDWVNEILEAAGMAPLTRSISPRAAYAIGAAMEFVYTALRIKGEPRMTRFLARELSTSHWFDISAARRDLGYEPRITMEEGMRRLTEWLRQR